MTRDILALDFYGRGITAALALIDEKTDTLRIRKILRHETSAFSNAFVRNMEDAKRDLSQLLNEIFSYTSNTPTVVVGVRGNFLSFLHRAGFATVTSRGRVIREPDIEEVINNSIPASLDNETQEVLDILPLSYAVDGNVGIMDPNGMKGFTLEVETFLSIALSSHLANLNTVLTACECGNYQWLATSVAMGETVLNASERKANCLFLDIGEVSTSALFYQQGSLMDGWELNDGMDTLIKQAADLLLNDEETTRKVLQDNPPGTDKYTDSLWEDAGEILLQKLKAQLLQSVSFVQHYPTHLVLGGYGANKLMLKLAKEIFEMRKTRIASFDDLIADCDVNLPQYDGALSLIFHALEREKSELGVAQVQEQGLFDKVLSKFGFGN